MRWLIAAPIPALLSAHIDVAGGAFMARALWKGAISFGLIYASTKKTGKEVDWAHIVKGYEYRKGEFVALADADFKHANVKASETIEIEEVRAARRAQPCAESKARQRA